MTDYPAGTVAVATVRGVPNVRVIRVDFPTMPEWMSFEQASGWLWHSDENVTDVRPLVVLDPSDTDTLDRLVTLFHQSWSGCEGSRGIGLGGALRMLMQPPRIPEPAVWSVVRDELGDEWVRTGPLQSTSIEWLNVDNCIRLDFDDIPNPVLIRDGVEDESC